jgi:DNA-binding HxlR family transcriptional regulator
VPRSYEDGCAAAHALDLVGERWALLVVREMVLGPKRFTDLRTGLPGISPNVLSQRLDELERAGVVRRYRLLPPARAWVYELTSWGRELEPIIIQLGRWGARSPFRGPAALNPDSLILSFRTMFDPAACGDLRARYEFRLCDYRFHAEVANGSLAIERGSAVRPDAVVSGAPDTIAALVYEGADLTEALAAGDLTVEGDVGAVERFFTLFSLPAPAEAPECQPAGAARVHEAGALFVPESHRRN